MMDNKNTSCDDSFGDDDIGPPCKTAVTICKAMEGDSITGLEMECSTHEPEPVVIDIKVKEEEEEDGRGEERTEEEESRELELGEIKQEPSSVDEDHVDCKVRSSKNNNHDVQRYTSAPGFYSTEPIERHGYDNVENTTGGPIDIHNLYGGVLMRSAKEMDYYHEENGNGSDEYHKTEAEDERLKSSLVNSQRDHSDNGGSIPGSSVCKSEPSYYICNLCNHRGSLSAMTKHINCHAIEDLTWYFTCKLCGDRVQTEDDVQAHTRTRQHHVVYFCCLCGQGFMKADPLKTHIYHKHGRQGSKYRKGRPIAELLKGLTTGRVLIQKRLLRSDDNGNSNGVLCPEKFDLDSLIFKKNRYHGNTVFTCALCASSYNIKHNIIKHIKYEHSDVVKPDAPQPFRKYGKVRKVSEPRDIPESPEVVERVAEARAKVPEVPKALEVPKAAEVPPEVTGSLKVIVLQNHKQPHKKLCCKICQVVFPSVKDFFSHQPLCNKQIVFTRPNIVNGNTTTTSDNQKDLTAELKSSHNPKNLINDQRSGITGKRTISIKTEPLDLTHNADITDLKPNVTSLIKEEIDFPLECPSTRGNRYSGKMTQVKVEDETDL